jgi:hypothetical protein
VAIDKAFIVNLRGKDVPLYAGVLDAATRAGLKSLTTQIVQIPSPENGHMAIVLATATFDDGRCFSDVGDCSPANTSPQIASAALRMASTRAKGRVLRDAINCGQTLLEELPDLDDAPAPQRNGHRQPQPQAQQQAAAPAEVPPMTCSEDGKPLTKGQYEVSLRAYGRPLCPGCQKAAAGRN